MMGGTEPYDDSLLREFGRGRRGAARVAERSPGGMVPYARSYTINAGRRYLFSFIYHPYHNSLKITEQVQHSGCVRTRQPFEQIVCKTAQAEGSLAVNKEVCPCINHDQGI